MNDHPVGSPPSGCDGRILLERWLESYCQHRTTPVWLLPQGSQSLAGQCALRQGSSRELKGGVGGRQHSLQQLTQHRRPPPPPPAFFKAVEPDPSDWYMQSKAKSGLYVKKILKTVFGSMRSIVTYMPDTYPPEGRHGQQEKWRKYNSRERMHCFTKLSHPRHAVQTPRE